MAGDYDFHAEDGDTVFIAQEPDGSWAWKLVGSNGKLKLEQGNFRSAETAENTARKRHGDGVSYEVQEEQA